jgi:hypothetical protein
MEGYSSHGLASAEGDGVWACRRAEQIQFRRVALQNGDQEFSKDVSVASRVTMSYALRALAV